MGEGAVGNTDVRGVNIRESWRDGCSGVATILKEQSFYTGITTSTLAQLVYKESTLKLYTGSQRLQASTARLARVQGHRSGGGVTSEESFLDVGDTFAYLVGTRNSKGCYSLGLFQINSYSTPADDEALSFGANLSGTLMQVVDDGSASSREVMERRE